MPTSARYVLSNDHTGTETTHATLDAALDALGVDVGVGDHWVIHEIIRDSIARCVVDGVGPGSLIESLLGRV